MRSKRVTLIDLQIRTPVTLPVSAAGNTRSAITVILRLII